MAAPVPGWRRMWGRFRRSTPAVIGLAIALVLLFVALFGRVIAPYPGDIAGSVATAVRFRPPSMVHWFGTNELGQDVFSLVLAGARVSLLSGLAVVVLGSLVGTLVGAIAGFIGGLVDEVLMRVTDLMLTLPSLILAMAVAAALGPGIGNMIIAISVSWWPGFARLVRGEVLARREAQFVEAARAVGAGPMRVLLAHILPNIMSAVMVKMSLDMGFAILTVASLGFVGIGVSPPTPEWGAQLAVSRGFLPDDWWTAIFPGLAIVLAVLACNLLGDGLRDMLDPRAQR